MLKRCLSIEIVFKLSDSRKYYNLNSISSKSLYHILWRFFEQIWMSKFGVVMEIASFYLTTCRIARKKYGKYNDNNDDGIKRWTNDVLFIDWRLQWRRKKRQIKRIRRANGNNIFSTSLFIAYFRKNRKCRNKQKRHFARYGRNNGNDYKSLIPFLY